MEKLRKGSLIVISIFLLLSYVMYGIALVNGGNNNNFNNFMWGIITFNVIIIANFEKYKQDLENRLVNFLNKLNYVLMFAWAISVAIRIFM